MIFYLSIPPLLYIILYLLIGIASETKTNLAKLKLTILQLLAVCGGVDQEDIYNKIHFIMSHNVGVETLISEELGTDHKPDHLYCSTHPVLMFTRELTKVWKELDQAIGPKKIFAGFSVNICDEQVSVAQQFVDCSLRLVTHDFDHKAWNKASEFDMFISPKTNPAKRLQAERFNSFVYCCLMTVYLDQDISNFLEANPNITNSLACIVRAFSGLMYVRILACVGALLGNMSIFSLLIFKPLLI